MSTFTESLKRLKLSPKRKSVSLFLGAYNSMYKGQGLELSDIREYVPGDNVKDIDWNATAKTNKAYVRKYKESRELTILFVVDTSSSMTVSYSSESAKINAIIDIITLISMAAMQHNDRIGLVLYNSKQYMVLPFRKGRPHVRQIINSTMSFLENSHFIESGDMALKEILLRGVKKKTLCFLITDTIDFSKEYLKVVKAVNTKHELTIFGIDPGISMLSEIPQIALQDSETGEVISIANPLRIQESITLFNKTYKAQEEMFARSRISYCSISPDNDILKQVVTHFVKEERAH